MADLEDVNVRVQVRRKVLAHVIAYWKAKIRRAPKREREALRVMAAREVINRAFRIIS